MILSVIMVLVVDWKQQQQMEVSLSPPLLQEFLEAPPENTKPQLPTTTAHLVEKESLQLQAKRVENIVYHHILNQRQLIHLLNYYQM